MIDELIERGRPRATSKLRDLLPDPPDRLRARVPMTRGNELHKYT